jgi:hypothetical protein
MISPVVDAVALIAFIIVPGSPPDDPDEDGLATTDGAGWRDQ